MGWVKKFDIGRRRNEIRDGDGRDGRGSVGVVFSLVGEVL